VYIIVKQVERESQLCNIIIIIIIKSLGYNVQIPEQDPDPLQLFTITPHNNNNTPHAPRQGNAMQ